MTRHLAAGALGIVLFAVLVPAAGSRPDTTSEQGLLTEVEYSGTWSHTYTGSPGGSAKNPGSETIKADLKFTESVSLFTPESRLGATGHGANSLESPVKVTLSGSETVTYSGSPAAARSCSATFSARSGLKGNDWTAVSPAGMPVAYISVNESATKGVVAVYAEPPVSFRGVHPEFVVRVTSGDADPTADCGPNSPYQAVCDDISLNTDPRYTSGDRGFSSPPYGFRHAVVKLDPQKPSYSRRYSSDPPVTLSTCDGKDVVTWSSLLVVNNRSATGLPSTQPTTTTPAPKPKPPPVGKTCPPKSSSAVRRDVLKQMIDEIGGLDKKTVEYLKQNPDAAALALALSAYAKGVQQAAEQEEKKPDFICVEDSIFWQDFDGYLGGTRRFQALTAPLFRVHQALVKGKPSPPSVSLDRTQMTRLLTLSSPTTLTVRAKSTLKRGSPVTVSRTVTLVPPRPAKPAITMVTFGGTPTAPTIVVQGTNLGKLPARDPVGHPSGLNGCPLVANDDGYLYGTSLYLAVPSQNWAAGRYRPSLNETDCLDLVVTKFTPTEVDFHFGASYKAFYPKFTLAAGLPVTVVVNGATANVTVKYA